MLFIILSKRSIIVSQVSLPCITKRVSERVCVVTFWSTFCDQAGPSCLKCSLAHVFCFFFKKIGQQTLATFDHWASCPSSLRSSGANEQQKSSKTDSATLSSKPCLCVSKAAIQLCVCVWEREREREGERERERTRKHSLQAFPRLGGGGLPPWHTSGVGTLTLHLPPSLSHSVYS